MSKTRLWTELVTVYYSLEVLLMILDKLTTRELMFSTTNCTTAMIHDYHMIASEWEGRKAG